MFTVHNYSPTLLSDNKLFRVAYCVSGLGYCFLFPSPTRAMFAFVSILCLQPFYHQVAQRFFAKPQSVYVFTVLVMFC